MSLLKYLIVSSGKYIPRPIKVVLRNILPLSFYESLANKRVVIVSFPKCGRSWLRLMLSEMICKSLGVNEVNDLETNLLWYEHPLIPHITVDHDDALWKTPDELDKDKSQYKGCKIIFLVRDPRDVVVSWYFQLTKRKSSEETDKKINLDSISKFIRSERSSLKTIINFYNIWLKNKGIVGDFLIVTYENLSSNPYEEIKKILNFSGIEHIVSKTHALETIEENTFDKVREKEKSKAIKHEAFKSFDLNDPESFKARKGIVGGYREYFNQEDIDYINKEIKNNLNPEFGY